MTLSEFKAWLEGFSEAFTDGVPNADQWAKISEKLGQVKMATPSLPSVPQINPNDIYPRNPKVWYEAPLDVYGKARPTFADPVVSPLLKPQITCTGKALPRPENAKETLKPTVDMDYAMGSVKLEKPLIFKDGHFQINLAHIKQITGDI